MERTKTASRTRSQSLPNAANDQPSDHSPLNETPFHTILPDEIIPRSKLKSSKKPISKPKPKATRRLNRMKSGTSSKTTASHVNLCSDEETVSEKEESDKEELSEKGKETAEEDSHETEETLSEMAKTAEIIYQRRKKIAFEALPLPVEKSASPSLENEEVET